MSPLRKTTNCHQVIGSGATPISKQITLENELKIQVLMDL